MFTKQVLFHVTTERKSTTRFTIPGGEHIVLLFLFIVEILAKSIRKRSIHCTRSTRLVHVHREIEVVAPDTKVVHSQSVAIFPFKPRDFVYLLHHRKLRDGTMVVLNR